MNTEFQLIHRYFAESARQFNRSEIVLGIGDDGALVDVPNDKLLCVATDVLVVGTHFPEDASPDLIAHRALAVNLSDMAAMGASPLCFTLGLTLPEANETWLAKFSEGLLKLANQYACPLIGGDTTRGSLAIAITMQGLADKDSHICRDRAAIGDLIYVTGSLGDAALALPALGIDSHLSDVVRIDEALGQDQHNFFAKAYYEPTPRVAFGCAVASLVSSGIDISDGLMGDLGHIIKASEVGAKVDLNALPVSDVAKSCSSEESQRAAALFGGDDYELCLTVKSDKQTQFENLAREHDVSVSRIGEITQGDAIQLYDHDGSVVVIDNLPYEHFR